MKIQTIVLTVLLNTTLVSHSAFADFDDDKAAFDKGSKIKSSDILPGITCFDQDQLDKPIVVSKRTCDVPKLTFSQNQFHLDFPDITYGAATVDNNAVYFKTADDSYSLRNVTLGGNSRIMVEQATGDAESNSTKSSVTGKGIVTFEICLQRDKLEEFLLGDAKMGDSTELKNRFASGTDIKSTSDASSSKEQDKKKICFTQQKDSPTAALSCSSLMDTSAGRGEEAGFTGYSMAKENIVAKNISTASGPRILIEHSRPSATGDMGGTLPGAVAYSVCLPFEDFKAFIQNSGKHVKATKSQSVKSNPNDGSQ